MRATVSPRTFDSAAHVLSFIGSPPVLALPIALLIGIRASGSPSALQSVAELLLAASVLPTVCTFALFRAGRTSTLDLREHSDRAVPSAITALSCVVGWAFLRFSAAPTDVTNLAIAVAAQMSLLALLTRRWKVSYHAASAAALVAVSRPLANPSLTLTLLLLACCVGWARVHQRRHTVNEVLVGALTTLPIGVLV